MKKFIAILLCIGLVSHSGAIIAQTPKQKILKLWKCRPSNPNPECSIEDRKSSKKWLAGAAAVVLAAVLAGLGIAITAAQVKKEQDIATIELSTLAAVPATAEKKIDPAIWNQYHEFEIMKRNYEQELETLRAQESTDMNKRLIQEKEKDLVRIDNQMKILRNMMEA